MRTRRRLVALVAVVLVIIAAAAAVIAVRASDKSDSSSGIDVARRLADAFARRPIAGKLDSRLAEVFDVVTAQGRGPALAEARRSALHVRRRRVRVIVEPRPGQKGATERLIAAAGGTVEARGVRLLQALVPPRALARLAQARTVALVRPPLGSSLDAPVAGQGIAATNAAAWHARGYTGAGVTVAVIDLGFKHYAALQEAGELPATLTTKDFCSGNFATEEDHGAGVAEIVYELAPRARLLLICVDQTEVRLRDAYRYAKSENAQIVSHSVSWFLNGRGDGTGEADTPAAIVAQARRERVLWVNAAGNRAAHNHWSGVFADSDGDGFHNFSGTDNSITVSDFNGCFSLKWDDWPRSKADYNLYLVRPEDGAIVEQSINPQRGAERPVEALCHVSLGETLDLKISRAGDLRPLRLDLWSWGKSPPNLEYEVAAGSVTEPGSSPNAMAVGAICWLGDALQDYSSRGPTIDGRVKPDIAAPTSVSNATYGASSGCSGGFSGTSSSTPHVAGAAALVKQRFPSATPEQLQAYLEQNAIDLGVRGKDNDTGAGKLSLPAVNPGSALPTPRSALLVP